MGFFREILLGIVQGITSFLPVSSSGHIILLGNIFGMDSEYLTFLLAILKLGSLVALVIVLFGDIIKMIVGSFALIQDSFANIFIFIKKRFHAERDGYYVLDTNRYKRLVLMMLFSFVASSLTALFIEDIAKNIGTMPVVIGICFVISALLLIFSEQVGVGERSLKNMGTFDAVAIGIAQGIAVIPGLSRIVLVYALALALGFGRGFAYRYSCYLAIPTFLGSALYELVLLAGLSISISNLADILAGLLFSAVISTVCLKIVLRMVKNGFNILIPIYGMVFGVIVIICGMVL